MAAEKDGLSMILLNNELKQARSHLVEILLEIEDLNLRVIPLIKGEYAARIGIWLIEESRVRLSLFREKEKKRALLQEFASQGKEIADSVASEKEERRLDQWDKAIAFMVTTANRSMMQADAISRISVESIYEMKECMRALVWRFHPDLHLSGSFSGDIFSLAQSAYAQGDIGALRLLEQSSHDEDSLPAAEEDTALLLADIELTNAQISFFGKDLDAIKCSEPYLFGNLLQDEGWVDQQISIIQSRIYSTSRSLEDCERQTKELSSMRKI